MSRRRRRFAGPRPRREAGVGSRPPAAERSRSGSRLRSALCAAAVLFALGVDAEEVIAQVTQPRDGSANGARPTWTANWNPLARVADLPREAPGGRTPFPSLLTLPPPRVGLFWTAGNPAAMPLETMDTRLEFRAGGTGLSGGFARPLDPGSITRGTLSAFGWRPLGERGAAIGRLVVERSTLGDSLFADVVAPHGSNPFIVIDTIGDPVRRTAARLEGATGWRFGRLALGIGLGFEGQETNTIESPVPKRGRSALPGLTAGLALETKNRALAFGLHGRSTRGREQIRITTISQPSRIFRIEGFEEPVPLDLQPDEFERRFERDAWALGASLGGQASGIRWNLFGQREEVTEEQLSDLLSADPPRDRWAADGWSAGGALQWPAAGETWLLTAEGRYTSLEGEALRADIDAVVFLADEERFRGDLEVRLLQVGGWEAAGRIGMEREVRNRRDRLAEERASIRSWHVGAAAEVARRIGSRTAISVAGLFSRYDPAGEIPDPAGLGEAIRRFVAPELAFSLTEAREVAGEIAFRWQAGRTTGLWLSGRAGSVDSRGGSPTPLAPDGSRTGWTVTLGLVLEEAWR